MSYQSVGFVKGFVGRNRFVRDDQAAKLRRVVILAGEVRSG
jgi:hypothetical protein